MKHSRISVAQSSTIARAMRGRMAFVGGAVSPSKVSGVGIVAVRNTLKNTCDILNGAVQASGPWREQDGRASDVVAKRAIVNGQGDSASRSQTLRFITLFRLVGTTEGIMC